MSYARFYKCDLHMHSPMDAHWRDENTRLRPDDTDERKAEVARQYLHACHAVGLEVIAITDHNFALGPEYSFVRWLRQENEHMAAEKGRAPLIIFPGFEIEAHVGKGCHVICLFPQEIPLNILGDRVTTLGLPADRRFEGKNPIQSQKRLPEILGIVQQDSNYKGVVIAAHVFSDGLFDKNKIAGPFQENEWLNPDLLAIEIPKPFEELSPGWKNLLANNEACEPRRRRKRPIAYLMSSDSYRLTADPEQPGNHIGYRFTWIKMSYPSIESLRQAFLDHTSRIRFGPEAPEQGYTYPKIRRVRVQQATFLRDIDWIEWSPNFNCLIGSRGTGKSTLLDYIRTALDRLRKEDVPPSLFEEISGRVTDTFKSPAKIEVEVETSGGIYRIVYTGMQREIYEQDAPLPINPPMDVRALFPCRILSQREIFHSVDRRDRTALRRILDEFISHDLKSLEVKERTVLGTIGQIEAEIIAKQAELPRRTTLETELHDLQNRLDKQKELKDLLPQWQGVEAERDFFTRLFEESTTLLTLWRERLADLDLRATLLSEELRTSPNAATVNVVAQTANYAVQALHQAIEKALDDWAQVFQDEEAVIQREYQQWLISFTTVRTQFESVQAATGTSVQTISEIPQRILNIRSELEILNREQVAIAELEQQRASKLAELRHIWREQTRIRQEKAEELMSRLRPSPQAKPYVEIRIVHQGDVDETCRVITKHIKNRTRLNESDIHELITASSEEVDSIPPLQQFITEARRDVRNTAFQRLSPKRQEAFNEFFDESVIRQLELERIPDAINYYVYRLDGTLAGPIEKVSAGQQGTAILNLLLAAGNEPLLVDTPEEGLDNEGVYAELVPLFRRAKEERQIILVTHNANLPVNADAENIVALEAAGWVADDVLQRALAETAHTLSEGQIQHIKTLLSWPDWGKRLSDYLTNRQWTHDNIERIMNTLGESRVAEGRVKRVEVDTTSLLAVGALDNPAVKNAVQNIMEGSEEAFRRRREKYGF